MDTIFIKSHGKLIRYKNTLAFIDENKRKKVLPIENIKQILIYGNVSLTSGAIKLLISKRKYVHFFSKYGNYLGSLYPKSLPAKIIIKQIEKYNNSGTRLYIAKQIISACRNNFYEIFRRKTEEAKKFYDIELSTVRDIYELMGLESQIFKLAYNLFDKVSKKYKVIERTRNPPLNEANALISYLNSTLYALILTEIHKKGLLPSISYLHEPQEDRPSLSLDIAEIFKPVFTFRLSLYLINKGILNDNDFISISGGVFLSSTGREKVLNYVDKILRSKFRIKKVGKRSLSYIISWQVEKLKEFLEDKSIGLNVAEFF
ncbi:MAG: CRISPR-associated endonuclease Cas1 [Nanopusillaceae archaeon]